MVPARLFPYVLEDVINSIWPSHSVFRLTTGRRTLPSSHSAQAGMSWYSQCQLVPDVLTLANHDEEQAGPVALCAPRTGEKVPADIRDWTHLGPGALRASPNG